jgi:kynureninase
MTLFRNYWFPQEERLLQQFTKIVGAASSSEICLVSSLTVNLHVALSTFYRPLQSERKKIMIISPEFNSDVFAIKSWLSLYGIDDGLIEVNVEDINMANDNIIAEIEKSKDEIQVLSFSAVNYVTG